MCNAVFARKTCTGKMHEYFHARGNRCSLSHPKCYHCPWAAIFKAPNHFQISQLETEPYDSYCIQCDTFPSLLLTRKKKTEKRWKDEVTAVLKWPVHFVLLFNFSLRGNVVTVFKRTIPNRNLTIKDFVDNSNLCSFSAWALEKTGTKGESRIRSL